MEGQLKSEQRLRALSDHPSVKSREYLFSDEMDGDHLGQVPDAPAHDWDATPKPPWREIPSSELSSGDVSTSSPPIVEHISSQPVTVDVKK